MTTGLLESQLPLSAAADAPVRFFDSALAAFERAAAAAGAVARDYEIGGRSVRLCFAGSAFLPYITPAFEHLAAPPSCEPALTVCFFDNESTGTVMPPPPWGPDDYGRHGVIVGYNTDRIHTTFEPGVDLLHVYDAARARAVYWARTAARVPYWETSFPMRVILHWWLRDLPFQPCHAGAVGFPGAGALIAGNSGSGKTTTTLACLDSELMFAGDDYVLVRTDPEPYVYSLYSTAKLNAEDLPRFPRLAGEVSNRERLGTEKALLFLAAGGYRAKLSRGFPIRAIFLPRVTGRRDTRLSPARPADALKAIAPTTLLHLQRAGRQTLEKTARLVRRVPSYWLEAGTELAQIPGAVAEALRHGGR